MRERSIEKKLKKQVEMLGGLCLKWVSPGFTGVPDRKVMLPGGLQWFVETKTPTGKLSERQKYVHRQFKEMDFLVCVVWDESDLKNFIVDIKRAMYFRNKDYDL